MICKNNNIPESGFIQNPVWALFRIRWNSYCFLCLLINFKKRNISNLRGTSVIE